MSDIVVRQDHALSPEEAKSRISGLEEMMGKYGVQAEWAGNHAELKGMAISGSIEVSDAEVVVSIKLGMMAKAVGVDPDRLKASIEKRLGPALTEA